jgi:uncharacterized protein YukJ
MALRSYGVLVGKCVRSERDTDPETPHMSLFIDAAGETFRAAINVKSSVKPSEVAYYFAQDFSHPVLQKILELPAGFNRLDSNANSGALDYIRSNLFPFEEAIALPPDLPGADNDLSDIVESLARRAIADPDTRIFIFGEPFPDGIHDVHMNQGNDPTHVRDDGVWQDGAMMIHTPSLNRWSAVFLAFQSQSIHTNDRTGHAEPGSLTFEDVVKGRPVPPKPEPVEGQPVPEPLPQPGQRDLVIRIVSAMVNPKGPEGQPGFAGEGEWVQVVSLLPQEIDLTGWAILNRNDMRSDIPAGTMLPAAGFLRLFMAPGVPLGNSGGLITLVDPQGLKVHGVSYTADQARREGFPIGF